MRPDARETAAISDRPPFIPVRAGDQQDWGALEAFLRESLPWLSGEFDVVQFPNGYANLTFLVSFGGDRLVVRRPPFGKIAPGAHDMVREFKALSAISPVFAQVPRPWLLCEDPSVIGAPFLVVEFRHGVGIWDAIPSSMRHHDRVEQRVGGAVVKALAGLHLLRVEGTPIEALGRPIGFVERQLSGWTKRWDLVANPRVPEMQEAADRLRATVPISSRVTVLHNDFKIDNCQFDPDNPDEVKSIFDWDQATVGEPLVDLGILLNYWPDPTDDPSTPTPYLAAARSMGMQTRAEVVSLYESLTGFDAGAVPWYEAFAAWKTAVVQQQLYARYERGETGDSRMAGLVPSIKALAQRALRLIEAIQ